VRGVRTALIAATALAVVATAWGLSVTQSGTTFGRITFHAAEVTVTAPAVPVHARDTALQMATPTNATQGTLHVTLAWTDAPIVPRTVTVDVAVATPPGASVTQTLTWDYSPLGPSTTSFAIDLGTWAQVPEAFLGSLDEASLRTLTWPALDVTLTRTDAGPAISAGQLTAALELRVTAFEARSQAPVEGGP
jgi:hypothetical protein